MDGGLCIVGSALERQRAKRLTCVQSCCFVVVFVEPFPLLFFRGGEPVTYTK